MTFKGQGQHLTSGLGNVVTQLGQIAHQPMHLDERNVVTPITCLYLFLIASYWGKTTRDLG